MKSFKLFLLLIGTAILCLSCASDSIEPESIVQWTEAKSSFTKAGNKQDFQVTQFAAEYFVRHYLKKKDYDVQPYKVDEIDVLYIFNFEDGWIAISGDKRTNPIIAESHSGSFDLSSIKYPNAVWLKGVSSKLLNLRSSSEEPEGYADNCIWNDIPQYALEDSFNNSCWVKVLVSVGNTEEELERIDHLIPTKWGQDSPWNEKTPRSGLFNQKTTKTCCVAVAISQILYYMYFTTGSTPKLCENISSYHYNSLPTPNYSLNLTNWNYNSSRWSQMALNSNDQGNTSYVADLLAQVGKLSFVHYDEDESVVYGFDSTSLLSNDLDHQRSNYSFNRVYSALHDNQPVIIQCEPNTGDVGHVWIIDGFLSKEHHYSSTYAYYYVEDATTLSEEYNGYPIITRYTDEEMDHILPNHMNGTRETDSSHYAAQGFFMNWGWADEYGERYDDNFFSIEPNIDWLEFNPNRNISYIYTNFSLI